MICSWIVRAIFAEEDRARVILRVIDEYRLAPLDGVAGHPLADRERGMGRLQPTTLLIDEAMQPSVCGIKTPQCRVCMGDDRTCLLGDGTRHLDRAGPPDR